MAWKNQQLLGTAELVGTDRFQQSVSPETQQMLKAGLIDVNQGELRDYFTNPTVMGESSPVLFSAIKENIIKSERYSNPFKQFKRVNTPDGVISEIHTHLLKAAAINYDATDLLKKVRTNQERLYHSTNRRDVYKTSITNVDWNRAFDSPTGIYDLIAQTITAMYNSNEADEQEIFENLFVRAEVNGDTFHVQVPDVTAYDETGKATHAFIYAVKSAVGRLGQMKDAISYNPLGLPIFAAQGQLSLILTAPIVANVDLNALAPSFNMSYAELKENTIVTSGVEIKGFQAALVRNDWFVVGDVVNEMQTFYDPSTLTTNYYYHVHGIYSYSRANPCIIFTTEPGSGLPTVTQNTTGLKTTVERDGEPVTTFSYGYKKRYYVKNELQGSLTSSDENYNPYIGHDVAPNAVLYDITITGAEGEAIPLSSKTSVNRLNELRVQPDLPKGATINIKTTSTYYNPEVKANEQVAFVSEAELTVE